MLNGRWNSIIMLRLKKALKLSLMARKDQESMMQSKMAAAPNLPTTHLTKNWLLLKNQMKLM